MIRSLIQVDWSRVLLCCDAG